MPKNRRESEVFAVHSLSKGTKIALILSLSLHIILFFVMRGTAIYGAISRNTQWIPIEIMNAKPEKSMLPKVFDSKIEATERKLTPTKRETAVSRETSPRNLMVSEISRRQIIAKREITTSLNVPSVNPEISSEISLPGNASFKPETDTGPGLYSQNDGMGKGSISNPTGMRRLEMDSAKILATPEQKIPITKKSVSEKLEVYKDSEMPFVYGLRAFGNHITNTKPTKKVDVVFILDISESMQDNIGYIKRHMYRMIESFKEGRLDYTLGLVTFHYNKLFDWLGTEIDITEQTHNIEEIRAVLDSIKVSGGERQLDALMKSFSKVKFRSGASRHFIFVTDEYVKGTYTISEVLREAKRSKVIVDVLGKDEPFQRSLAEQTGGIWMPIEFADMN